jgi:ABC-type bacteriocin/lantibiotic exporter with double-glycine peptidase domain
MNFLNKILFLLTSEQKKSLFFLSVLMLIGMLFEMLGLGILLPALGLMLKTDIVKDYPSIKPFLNLVGNPSKNQLVFFGMLILVVLYFLKSVFLIFLTWKQSKFSAELSANISEQLFYGYLSLPYSFHLQRNSTELLRNIQSEVGVFTSLSQGIITLSIEISVVLSVAFILILVEPVGAVTISIFLGISGYLFFQFTKKRLLNWGEKRQYHVGLAGKYLIQGLSGVKDVKLSGREEDFVNEYSVHNKANANILTRVITLSQAPRFYLELLAVVGLAGLIILMIMQEKPLVLLVPTLGTFAAASFRIIPSVNRIVAAMQNITYSKPAVDVLFREFKFINEHNKSLIPGSKINFNDCIEIKDLKFQYESSDVDAVNEISIKINKGACIGLIGQSGSGKSTLVDIILGLLKPTGGNILVDGKDIQGNIREWQKQVGYVPQSIYLTDDTLRRNIAFGIPENLIDENAVKSALSAAQLDVFVSELHEGLETVVGERGVRLSGGQRQRIGIARALYHNPEVLVLDEATSALDGLTEDGVMEALNIMHGSKTLIIVAHRLSTVENCDILYRLENGKIIEAGKPSSILKVNALA